jgi:hypothetical protein
LLSKRKKVMKKVIFAFLFLITLLSSALKPEVVFSEIDVKNRDCKNVLISDPEIYWTEYNFYNGMWSKITHFSDGSIGVTPLEIPPSD